MHVTLRIATPGDAERITKIYLASRKTFLGFAPLAHSDAEVGEWIGAELIPAGVTVAEVGGKIAGFLASSQYEGMSWIDQFYLHPDFVALGIGTALLSRAIKSMPPPIRLCTFQQNSGSRRFYERHGFRLISLGDGTDNEERCPDALYEFPYGVSGRTALESLATKRRSTLAQRSGLDKSNVIPKQ